MQILFFLPVIAWAGPLEDASETGRLLAILLDAGRSAIAKNQDLINDASKANKGYTSDVFQRQVAEDFQQRTGIILKNLEAAQIPAIAKPLLSRLMEEAKKTIDTYQCTWICQQEPYPSHIRDGNCHSLPIVVRYLSETNRPVTSCPKPEKQAGRL